MKTKVHTPYMLNSGARVPSVTTILNAVLAKPALIHWAWECGTRGEDYRKVRDIAADIGTLAHLMIMAHLKGIPVDLGEYSKETIDKAENSFLSYLDWEKGRKVEPIGVEVPLVSEVYGYGGTIDCFASLDGQPTLIDFKTGKRIYPEMIYQVAAYRNLLLETGKQDMKPGCRILRIPRSEDEDFEERILNETQLKLGWEIFLLCAGIYEKQKHIQI